MTAQPTEQREPLSWGVPPLAEQLHFAEVAREVTSLVLRLEGPDPAMDELLRALEQARTRLADVVPPGLRPRIGKHADGDGRVYLDHCRDMGAFNPVFPVYDIVVTGPDAAHGTVTFPLAYEANAGCVNGGFLGVFFDQVVQHHNCDVGLSGATRNLDISYRRPVPVEVELTFTVARTVDERDVASVVELHRGDVLLCRAETRAALSTLPAVQPAISPRRGTAR